MAQANWWEDDEVIDGPAAPPAAAPASPGVIMGRPKTPPPPTDIQLENQDIARERLSLAQGADARAAAAAAQGNESERTAGFLAGRIVDAVGRLSQAGQADRSALRPTLGVETARSVFGDTAANYLSDAERQQVRAAQIDILDAALTLGTGAAYTKEQIEGYREAYFPQLFDEPSTIRSKQEALRSLLVNAQTKAGKAAPDIEAALAALGALSEPATARGDRDGEQQDPWPGVVGEDGKPLPPEGGYGRDPETGEWQMYGRTTDDSPATLTEAEKIANDPRLAEPDAAVLARQGFTMGLSDEAAGIGGALGNLLQLKNPIAGYKLWNSVEDAQVARARKNMGWTGTAIEVGSGFGGVGNVAGALTRLSTGQAARQGAKIGALGGYGYGEGLEGSVINTAGGAALGGALGGGAQAIGNKLSSLSARAGEQRGALANRALALDEAGRAEGVTVNRAMVDPSTANRVTGVDATLSGGPRVQREMRAIEGQIEERVGALGQGGRPMNQVSGGQTIEQAGVRAITETGKSASRKYRRAERLAGDAKIEAKESLRSVDEMIATLGETPGQNQAEIAFLQTLRDDLGQNLSVGALRRMRTSLRKRIRNGGLTFGDDEARVLGIMDAAADDIRAGLTAQGNVEAAQAFDAADKSYRARMEYINGTLQKVLGKRDANIPAERMWERFRSMAGTKGDSVGLRKFYATLTPEERLDVSATFADELGKNRAGEFTVASFISQAENLSDDAVRTIFGPEGAQSIRNLRLLGTEVKRVTGAMNSRTSKSGVVGTYRDWLVNGLLGATAAGGGGLAGNTTTAVAAGATALGANALRNALSAKLLMSTNITKWLRQAPRTADPAAIDRHFSRLGDIAKAEPALAGDIEMLRTAIMNAANDNVPRTGSLAASPEQGPDEEKPR